jgi:hypothetical protein
MLKFRRGICYFSYLSLFISIEGGTAMKKISVFTVIVSILLTFSLGAQAAEVNNAAASSAQKKKGLAHSTVIKKKAVVPAQNDTLVVLARLVEIPGKFPPNDIYNYVYIMKYRILKVVKGTYAAQEILVGHYNPRIPRKQIHDKMAANVKGDVTTFTVNAKHRLVLIRGIDRVWKDAVEDEYTDSDMNKYFAVKTDNAQ